MDACCNPCSPPSCGSPCKRYVQPPVPKSFKPCQLYACPVAAMDGNTVNRLSFMPTDVCTMQACRQGSFKPRTCVLGTDVKMSDCTTHRLSYMPHCDAKPACLIQPCHRPLNEGPMQSVTTQKHDYVPKPFMKLDSFKPSTYVVPSCVPMEDRTTNRLSYMEPGCAERPSSYKPCASFAFPLAKMEANTTQKLSYMPYGRCQPSASFAPRGMYAIPVARMDGNTTYTLSYLKNEGICRPDSYAPCQTYIFDQCSKFPQETTYKLSYLPCAIEKVQSYAPSYSVTCPVVPMSDRTTNRLSYMPHCDAKPAQIILPCVRPLNEGPMQGVTTQKHDYVPKPIIKCQSYKPTEVACQLNGPMEDRTTNRLSYMQPPCIQRVTSYRPSMVYAMPCSPMENNTTQKLSYMPWGGHQPAQSFRPSYSYAPPCAPVSNDTTSRLSYMAPGYCVDDCGDICNPCPMDGAQLACVNAPRAEITC